MKGKYSSTWKNFNWLLGGVVTLALLGWTPLETPENRDEILLASGSLFGERSPLTRGDISSGRVGSTSDMVEFSVGEAETIVGRPLQDSRVAVSAFQYVTQVASNATIYSWPVLELYDYNRTFACDQDSSTFVGFDTFFHQRRLANASDTDLVTPNVDTLYSSGVIDLSNGHL